MGKHNVNKHIEEDKKLFENLSDVKFYEIYFVSENYNFVILW